MIVPMKKITLLALEKDREVLLQKVRKAGVVHVEKTVTTGDGLSKLLNIEKDLNVVKNLLQEFVPKKRGVSLGQSKPSCMKYEETLTFASNVISLSERHKEDIAKASKVQEELSRCAPWGEFNLKDFATLESKGLVLKPLEMPLKTFYNKDATADLTLILVNTKKSVARALALLEKDELPEGLSSEIKEFAMPTFSTFELKEKLNELKAKVASYSKEMEKMAFYLNSVDAALEKCKKEIEAEFVLLNMPSIKTSENDHSAKNEHISSRLISLTGFLPSSDLANLTSLAKENGWAYLAKDPEVDDAVPTKIKNNRFVSLISPLTDFLGTLPGYREPDISLWFLLFFGIFFAMIFGDAGYGGVLTILSIFVAIKTKMKKKKIHTGVYMFIYLGIMTMIWGTLVCNWFGMDATMLPQFFRDISWERIASVTHNGIKNADQDNHLMHLSFTLGFAQLAIAHLIGIFRNIKSPKFLGDIGSLSMLTGMYFVVLELVVKMPPPFEKNYIWIAIGVGFALNFVFSNYESGLGQSIVESLKNIINMLLGVVNVFADIMSYIRLWAVGLAGGAISAAVNTMAGPTLKGALIIVGMLILLFGHGLNYAMNVLSVIVHGVRLNTLEFSNHLGLTWSGFKYEPFNE